MANFCIEPPSGADPWPASFRQFFNARVSLLITSICHAKEVLQYCGQFWPRRGIRHKCIGVNAVVAQKLAGEVKSTRTRILTGSPAFGTPEYTQATIASGQLARKYKIPLRASNANASNAPDEQSVYESQMSLWACLLGQVNFILHGHGWIEGGLCASYEKVILDAEMNQMMEAFLMPSPVNNDTLGVEAIAEVGPASHFFAAQQTLDRYETEHYNPMLSDWRNFESWRDAGSETASQRANKIWKQLLEDYKEPKLAPEVEEELSGFVDRRVSEGGAAPL